MLKYRQRQKIGTESHRGIHWIDVVENCGGLYIALSAVFTECNWL